MPAAGLLYRDSVEVDEQKYPMLVTRSCVRPDSEGAGRRRGAPGNLCEYGPTQGSMRVFYSLEGIQNPPQGVRGGGRPQTSSVYVVAADGVRGERPEAVGALVLAAGWRVGSRSPGGGGYGDPCEREPERVLDDVREGYVGIERAAAAYGVVIRGDPELFETLRVDARATTRLRQVRAQSALGSE